MTAPETENEQAARLVDVHRCVSCGGPCLTFKGSTWGWTCEACCRRHLEDQVARMYGGRRGGSDGGGPAVPAAAADTRKGTA